MSGRKVRRVLAAAVLVVLPLAACGTDDEAGEGGSVPSGKDLVGMLMTADDLGDGWAELDPPEDMGDVGLVTEKNRDLVPRMDLCDQAPAASQKTVADLAWEAFTQYGYETGDDRHLVFVQEFLRSDSETTVRATYDDLAAGIGACEDQVETSPDGEQITQRALRVPEIGEDRIGMRLDVSEPGGSGVTWDIRNVLARNGTVLLGLTVVEIVAPGTERVLDEEEIDALMTRVADRLP